MNNTIFGYFFIQFTVPVYSLNTIFLFECINQINSHNIIVSTIQFTIQYHWSHKQISWKIVDPIMSQSNTVFYTYHYMFCLCTCVFGTKENKIILLYCCIIALLDCQRIKISSISLYFILFYFICDIISCVPK